MVTPNACMGVQLLVQVFSAMTGGILHRDGVSRGLRPRRMTPSGIRCRPSRFHSDGTLRCSDSLPSLHAVPTMPIRTFRTAIAVLAFALPSFAFADPPIQAPSASLEEVLAPIVSDRTFTRSDAAIQVVNLRTGEEVFARDADRGLIPASTMKVLTAATALRTLGPSYRFKTEIWSDGRIDAAGVLRGNLYIKGGADPTLVVEKLWKLIFDLKAEGLTRIDGDVIYDEDFFGPDHHLVGWDKPEDIARGPSYYPPIGALSLNFNTAALLVGPGAEIGGPARVLLETPAGEVVVVDNQATTSGRGSRARIGIEREVEGGTTTFTVTGSTPSGNGVDRIYRTIDDPAAHFRGAFEEMLAVHGVAVSGSHHMGSTPADGANKLLTLRSPPLAAVLMDMNKLSNNFIAETVLRTVGAETYGSPGTTESGVQAVHDYLVSLGIPEEEFTLVNGSGLSRSTRIAPSHLTAVLVDMAADRRVGAEFQSSLAIAGQDGTLWRRLRDEPGRLRGKTGTIDGIHCLAGYVEAADGERYAFAFLVNDVSGGIWQVRELHDRFAREMFLVDADPDDEEATP